MRPLESVSGGWTGFWVQTGTRGHMHLQLHFADGKLQGGGDDQEGAFTIEGRYNNQEATVGFIKSYSTDHVAYAGRWDGAMIAGQWSFSGGGPEDAGDFEIWPEGEGEGAFESTLDPGIAETRPRGSFGR